MPLYRRVPTADEALQKIQDGVAATTDPLVKNPVTGGVLLQSVALTTSTTEVSHKLGRKPQGWIVVRQRAQADVWDVQDSNTRPELTLQLKASVAVTVDVYVF